MSPKMKVVLATIAAVLVLTLGTAAIALAQEEPTQPPQWQPGACGGPGGLGIDQHLEFAVEQGIITQAEADEIKAWLAERPAALDKLMGFRFNNANQPGKAFRGGGGGFGMGRGMGPGMMGGWGGRQFPPTPTN